jgi:hypothetical protein
MPYFFNTIDQQHALRTYRLDGSIAPFVVIRETAEPLATQSRLSSDVLASGYRGQPAAP